MSRYIDADVLYEKTAEWEASALAYIEKLNRTPLDEMDEDEKAEWRRWTAILGERSAFKHDVAEAPTADVVEVVRCKDCKFYNEAERMCNDTNGFDRYWKPTDFCSYGKRREE